MTLWTAVSGTGPPLLLLNGGPGMADYLGPVATLLEPYAEVHRFEPRGCGRSPSGGPFTLARAVADVEDLRAHWAFDRWWIVGHSWGVDLGLAYTLQHREHVLGLVGLAGGRLHDDRSWHRAYEAKRAKEALPPAFTDPSAAVNEALNAEWRTFCRRPSLLRELAELQTPALFLYGEHDIRPSWPTEQLAALLSQGEFRRLPHADHQVWQGNPDALVAAVTDFIEHG